MRNHINFSINNKNLQATRKINLKGTLSSQFLQKIDDEWIPIAEGERKQFGESMTKEIENFIGLDFEKLKMGFVTCLFTTMYSEALSLLVAAFEFKNQQQNHKSNTVVKKVADK